MAFDFTDLGEVVLSGQNPFMLLFGDGEGPPTTIASFWRVEYSPVGFGHALYCKSDANAGRALILTDNRTVAQFIQRELFAANAVPFGLFADVEIETVDATFAHEGDARSSITERVVAASHAVVLTWSDFLPAFVGGTSADPAAGRGHGHYALYLPARSSELTVDGRRASGQPRGRVRDGKETTSAGLAWAETWIRPIP